MHEIPPIASQRLKSIGIISLVEPVIQSPIQETNSLRSEIIEFKKGLELAQEINCQLRAAMNKIIPEN